MSGELPRLQAARRELEARYGLALLEVTELEIQRALAAVDSGEPPLDGTQDPDFWARLVDALPIDESCLFRDAELWRWLESAALPPLVDRALTRGPRLQALSLGCSGGQEAFSLAMLLLDVFLSRGMPASGVPRCAWVKGVDASRVRIAS